ncbi:hypothetical protein BJY00DRAFT_279191 [Aspergillus carlsbadensis]|nr:hypothetical protein BJY00DRAFT_279191 [Aspergillus carlsbadensis]
MKLTMLEAEKLVHDTLVQTGYSPQSAGIIASHLLDTQLRGYSSGGVAYIPKWQ